MTGSCPSDICACDIPLPHREGEHCWDVATCLACGAERTWRDKEDQDLTLADIDSMAQEGQPADVLGVGGHEFGPWLPSGAHNVTTCRTCDLRWPNTIPAWSVPSCPRASSDARPIAVPLRFDREVLAGVLVYHWRDSIEGCGCGWSELGRSWPVHIAEVYEDTMLRQRAQPAEGPHSRACGFRRHDHGPECHSNCPTCEFRRAVRSD